MNLQTYKVKKPTWFFFFIITVFHFADVLRIDSMILSISDESGSSVCRVRCNLQGEASFMKNIPLGDQFHYFFSVLNFIRY